MSITDMIELGQTGEEIIEYLEDIKQAIQKNAAISGYEFEDEQDRIDYITDSVQMITDKLSLLKQK